MTPPTFIRDARRSQLVRCAIEVIADVGYAQASLVRIARQAGVSRGVITYHFADRDELITAVVTEFYALADAELRPALDAEPTTVSKLRTFILGCADFYRRYPTEIAALAEIFENARARDGRSRNTELQRAEERELYGLAALVEQGQREGAFRECSPRVVAMSIREALNGLIREMRSDPNCDPLAYGDQLTDLFENGLRRLT